MAYQSESALENKLIEQLVSKGYQWYRKRGAKLR